jgi:alkanesulfonate monooxygenase SsuD/methylene tetrahydromethanopterin reductase-like flavin-dependent oxidoreductase (luciferase family)
LLGILAAEPQNPLVATAGTPPEELARIGAAFAKGRAPAELISDWMVDTFAIAGSPARCREGLAEIVAAGVSHPIAFEVPGVAPEQTIRAVHEHLMPHFLG